VSEAVDCVLQIVAGLEAAQRIGILHRDVKPSNCFRDSDGTVKIGDFGLSISTAIRTEPALTAAGAFLGTPAFCSPEQLRGDELNARSDMYSVGATLFFLLTGRTPFEGKNPVQLLATVLEQRAPSPKKLRNDIPRGLASVILRCLEKQPGERFRNYEELVQALAPYSSAAPTPATLGLRFIAGALDQVAVSLISFVLILLVAGDFTGFMNTTVQHSPPTTMFIIMLGGLAFGILYFTLTEGIWGFSLGKAICRLLLVGRDQSSPGLLRALGRALIYVGLPPLPYWVAFRGRTQLYLSQPQSVQLLMSAMFFIVVALLFCTARRRNGFAAIHDLITKTRVVARVALQARPVLTVSETPPPAIEGQRTVGPYHVLETLEKSTDVEWLLGYDLRLLRKVWVRVVAPGTPPVVASLRNIGRVGRLRWLTGRRSPEENWDAFEAVSGRSFANLIRTPQPWSRVRFWLYDLANEISSAEKDATLPDVLALNRIWITADGRAKLLDFPAPGTVDRETPGPPREKESRNADVRRFLNEAVTAALAGEVGGQPSGEAGRRLPLHAVIFLKCLPQLPDAPSITGALKPLLNRLAEVSQLRRVAIVAGCLTFPAVLACGMLLGISMLERWSARNPGVMELNVLLHVRDSMNSRWAKNQPRPTDRQFAIYIAQHYASAITNEARWTDLFALSLIQGEHRRFAEQSVAQNLAPTEKEIAEAEEAMKPVRPPSEGLAFFRKPWFPPLMFGATLAIYVGIPALVAALLFRGGLVLLAAGVTFVRRDGARASRLRVFWRGLVAWSPLLAAPVLFGLLVVPCGKPVAATVAALIVCGLTIISLALPQRGLPDRLAGTWPVPR
jgi:hypothetical protein